MFSGHLSHFLPFLVPLFLGLIIFWNRIINSFLLSFQKGLTSFFIILVVIHFGVSQPLMTLHHQIDPRNPTENHFCCIIQPSLSPLEPVYIPEIPKQAVLELSVQTTISNFPVYFPHFSRAPPQA